MSSQRPSVDETSSFRAEQEQSFWSRRKKFSPAMEAAFQAEMDRLRDLRVRRTGLAAVVLYAAFAITDRVMVPDVYLQALTIRFLLVIPLLLLATFSIPRVKKPLLREILLSSIVIVTGASLPWIFSLSNHPNSAYYETGITLVILFGNIVLNLRFRSAVVSSVILLGTYAIFLSVQHKLPPEVRLNNGLFSFSLVVISLLANFRTDQDQRRAYLARSREQARNAELSHAVELLGKLSSEDALTQVANRREFDRRLELEWARAKREGQFLALILIDVDCFKAYNDHYGHPAGDACLRGVASRLSSVLKRSSDLVARFGGEEFVALLPATGAEEAAALAERMRVAVRELQLPHEASSAAPIVTASFGVCAMRPVDSDKAAVLLDKADAALYRAKQAGRDRVAADRRAEGEAGAAG
ncbi:diguanylate cyclase [Noviherbaspirillum sp. UKPF54]|uniref:GGDEF domain-containing protein n=1 Tax=Noviherbaspirillum sp. UKPF54 TaxID=2601898 RepID=UPI0011B155E1|nr:diguanylate cyclase [Noviherbaspirillum sp. UKPF54]QDZ29980.1 GGDEF domain-containing protein [Noviherbaspirillum sp. UKPF54]